MKYMFSWHWSPNLVDSTIEKFLETGGALPGGLRLLGRWHGMSGTGVAIVEGDDAKALYRWYTQWANVMELDVTPCVDDADAEEVLKSMVQRKRTDEFDE